MPGKHEVEHDEARRVALEQLARAERRPPASSVSVALAPQVADDDLADDRLVVDDEDGAHARN